MKEVVYKPPTQAKYTSKATPYTVLPIVTRIGKALEFNESALATYTLYTVPAGKKARLIYFLLWRVDAQVGVQLDIDDITFWKRYATGTPLDTPIVLINLPYESGLEILSNLFITLDGVANDVRLTAIITEDEITNA